MRTVTVTERRASGALAARSAPSGCRLARTWTRPPRGPQRRSPTRASRADVEHLAELEEAVHFADLQQPDADAELQAEAELEAGI